MNSMIKNDDKCVFFLNLIVNLYNLLYLINIQKVQRKVIKFFDN